MEATWVILQDQQQAIKKKKGVPPPPAGLRAGHQRDVVLKAHSGLDFRRRGRRAATACHGRVRPRLVTGLPPQGERPRHQVFSPHIPGSATAGPSSPRRGLPLALLRGARPPPHAGFAQLGSCVSVQAPAHTTTTQDGLREDSLWQGPLSSRLWDVAGAGGRCGARGPCSGSGGSRKQGSWACLLRPRPSGPHCPEVRWRVLTLG